MAKTYKINGYLVDPNGDDLNICDIIKVIEDNSDLFGELNIAISPTWQWSDECAENFGCAFEQYEERFKGKDKI